MEHLIGRKVNKIFFNEHYLKFDTDKGPLVYTVSGDCCSTSVFYDFYGVKNLLLNGPVTEVREVDLHPDLEKDSKKYDYSIYVYGYQITTESKDLGLVTSVFSFRNYSNGYYGGYLNEPTYADMDVKPEINDDVIETENA